MAKKQNYGVDVPLKIENPGTDDWHLWRRDSNGDKWMGFFRSSDDALAWVRAHPGNFEVNNVPPPTSHKYTRRSQTNAVTTRQGTAGAARRTGVPAPKVAPSPVSKPETAKQRALRTAAKAEYQKHRDAEAADIEAGRTETA